MNNKNIKVDILPNYYLREDGSFNLDEALKICGKIAGVCYDKEGFKHLQNEPIERTERRIKMTLENGHHSVYDHIMISFELQNIPKMLAMVLNNEHEYTTSEKSARYTPVVRNEDSIITLQEEKLYKKWNDILFVKIKSKYSDIYSDAKIKKLAQENARYLVTVFMPTQMIYTTSLRQINYLVSWMQDYIDNASLNNDFEKKLSSSMEELIECFKQRNVLVDELMRNEKHRKLSLFGDNLDKKEIHFGETYLTKYKGSLAQLAQAQRHRTLDYQMEFLDKKEFFIPPIIQDEKVLIDEWINDMKTVENLTPQGELVNIIEMGKYEDFILKCKERLCSAAQLEIMIQTRQTLLNYKKSLEESNNVLSEDIEKYSHGARCTFRDFECTSDCKFVEGKLLTRKI